MTDREHDRREPSDVPGFGRVGGVDDPVPRAEYGDDREAVRAPDRHDRREQLLDLPSELRGEARSYYDGAMEADGFARRLRSIANELERHADAIAAHDEHAAAEDGERR
jgi:hypothetical protein